MPIGVYQSKIACSAHHNVTALQLMLIKHRYHFDEFLAIIYYMLCRIWCIPLTFFFFWYNQLYRVFTHSEAGPLQNPRLCIAHEPHSDSSHYYWQVFYKTVEDGTCDNLTAVEVYLQQLLPSSGYVVCPGIRKYPDEIRFKTKNLRQWGEPFNRMVSANCSQWHIPNNTQQPQDSIAFDCCKSLLHDINQLAQRVATTSDAQRVIRTLPTSNYPLSKLSPASHKSRVANIIIDRKNLTRKLNRLAPFDCDVGDKQSAELLQLVSSVHKNGSKVINELIEEGSHVLGEENLLKDSWHQDVVERLDYERDQQSSGIVKSQFADSALFLYN